MCLSFNSTRCWGSETQTGYINGDEITARFNNVIGMLKALLQN